MTDRLRLFVSAVAATAAIGAAVTGCSSHSDNSPTAQSSRQPGAATSTTASRPGTAGRTNTDAGTCALSSLPPQAADTVRLIHSGGPFPHPRNDGVVFQNRERRLPNQARGYYHEYTVDTPGASTRGTRRVITGGTPLKSPRVYYYTGDHYSTFCTITGAD